MMWYLVMAAVLLQGSDGSTKSVGIPTVQWQEDAEFLPRLLRERKPVLISGMPAVTTCNVDTLEQVSARLGTCRNVMQSAEDTFFYFDPAHPLVAEGACRLDGERYQIIPSMQGEEFHQALINANQDSYYYYSTSLKDASESLSASFDLTPFQILPNVTANFWSASAGCISQLHYDASHNIFTQLVGRKRFLLVSPSQAAVNLPLFPASHPMHRASALDWSQVDERIDVVLEKDQVLYIPPFWMHHVITETASASLNVYLPSKERKIAQELHAFHLPIDSDWLDVVQLAALNYVIHKVVSKVYHPKTVQDFAKVLIRRFTMLPSDRKAAQCDLAVANVELDSDFKSYYCVSGIGGEPSLENLRKSHIELAIVRLVNMFNRVQPGVRELLLVDWVELRILMGVQSKFVAKYVANCLY